MHRRPNVLFLLTDDQRFDTISGLGHPDIPTPNFDRLVGRGVAFDNAYIMGGSSGAVCMPSRAMIHTGRTLYHIDGVGQTIDPDHAMLGEHFARHGYDTFGTGKWHNGPETFARCFNAGASVFFGGMSDHWNVPVCDFNPDGRYQEPHRTLVRYGPRLVQIDQRYERFATGTHSTDLFVDDTRRWLASRDRDRPFFAYVSFMAPHDPREMPAEFLNRFDPHAVELPPNFMPEHPFDHGGLHGRDEQLAGFPRTENEVRRHIAEYHAMIAHLDARIGDLLDHLESSGQLDDTIVVFAGDNGLACGQHGMMGKECCYDHALHVPLLISGPGLPAGARRDNLCYLLDIFPTLCDLAGLDTPGTVEGRGLVPSTHGAGSSSRDELLFAMTRNQRAIRDHRHKLIETAHESTRVTQLFDLLDDPREMHDLADDSAHVETLTRLRRSLVTGWAALDDNREGQGGDFWRHFHDARDQHDAHVPFGVSQ